MLGQPWPSERPHACLPSCMIAERLHAALLLHMPPHAERFATGMNTCSWPCCPVEGPRVWNEPPAAQQLPLPFHNLVNAMAACAL